MRLRCGGPVHHWGTAIYVASSDSYGSRVQFSRRTEGAFDVVCDIHIGAITPRPHLSTIPVKPRRASGSGH
jgi:hypothetical protein